MPRILIVYYSRTGQTSRVAAQLASALRADIEPIVDSTPRTGVLGYLRSGYEALFRAVTPISAPAFNPRNYDIVLVGTPISDTSVPPPVRSYLRTQREVLPRVAFFCTGGVGADRAFAQMSKECGQRPVATMVLMEAELKTAAVPIAIARFIAHIRAAQGPARTSEDRDLREAGRARLGA